MREEKEKIVDSFLKQIHKNIPYFKSYDNQIFKDIKQDLTDSLLENENQDISEFIGSPPEVAKNILKSNDWNFLPASFKIRSIAYLIDLLISFFCGLLSFNLIIIMVNSLSPNFFNTTRSTYPALMIFVLTISIPLYVLLLYPLLFEGYFSTTIGKRIFGLWVVDESGIKINLLQALIRSVTKLLPFLLLIDSLFGVNHRSLYQRTMDQVARTYVITNKLKSDNRNDYINKVIDFIPFHNKEIDIQIDEFKKDFFESINDSDMKDPYLLFGNPRDCAKNILQAINIPYQTSNPVSRIIAYSIDFVISFLLGIVIMLIPMWFVSLFEPNYFQHITDFIQLIVILFIASIPLYSLIFYPIFFEGMFSRTIGKFILRIWTIDESGVKITWQQAFIRSLTKIMPILLIIDILIGIKQNKTFIRALDKYTKTKVVH